MDAIPQVDINLPLEAYEEKSYQNKELLEYLYNECYLSCTEIAEMLGTHGSTVSRWLNRHDIQTRDWSEHVELRYYADKDYADVELLYELYVEEKMSANEIAQIYGVTAEAILYQLRKNSIAIRNDIYDIPEFELEYENQSKSGFHGYPVWKGCDGKTLPVHGLVAIADGADPCKVFGKREYQVHHKNGCKIDNRPSNLEVLRWDDHGHQQREDYKNNTEKHTIKKTILAMLELQKIARA